MLVEEAHRLKGRKEIGKIRYAEDAPHCKVRDIKRCFQVGGHHGLELALENIRKQRLWNQAEPVSVALQDREGMEAGEALPGFQCCRFRKANN